MKTYSIYRLLVCIAIINVLTLDCVKAQLCPSNPLGEDFTIPAGDTCPISTDFTVNNTYTLTVEGELTIDGNTLLSNDSHLIINSGGKVTFNGPITFNNDSRLTINSGGEASINMNGANETHIQIGANIENNGTLYITGGELRINDANSISGTGGMVLSGVTIDDPNSHGTGLFDVEDTDCLTGNGCCGGTAACTTLPVTWLSFYGTPYQDMVELTWLTASEIDNDYFSIQRSADGVNFTEIGQINGHGTKTEESTYSFRDYSPLSGTTFYRLEQHDFDGDTDYSMMIMVKYQDFGNKSFQIHPTPSNKSFCLTNNSFEPSAFNICDAHGQVIYTNSIQSNSTIEITPSLPPGIYFLKTSQTENIVVQKLIIK